MRSFIIVAFLLQFSISGNCQNADSFSRAIDSSTKAMDKRMQALHDSLDQLNLKRSMEQNGQNLDRFLADMKEREKTEKRQMYIRIGLGLAFLIVLIVGLTRRRKNKIRQ